MSRFDKYDPVSGGFRARLGFAAAADTVVAVGLDANGVVQAGAANSGVKGVICPSYAMSAGDVVDVMTDGEVVDMTGLTAGTTYYASDADGTLGNAAPAAGTNAVQVGHTVEDWRLVVRVGRVQG